MKFQELKINQEFRTSNGRPAVKVSQDSAKSLVPVCVSPSANQYEENLVFNVKPSEFVYVEESALEERFANAQYELENQGRLDQDDISMVAVKISSSNLSTEGKVNAIEGLLKVQQFWSRRCRVTGQGFDEGFLLFDTDYVKEESDAVAVLRDYYLSGGDVAVAKRYKDDAVLERAYDDELSVYTEWDFSDEVAEGNFYLELSNGSLKSWDEYLESFK